MSGALSGLETALGSLGTVSQRSQFSVGGIVLSGPAIPDRVLLGGEHILAVRQIIGGGKTVNLLGPQPSALEWQAAFAGPQAMAQALAIDAMRTSGRVVTISFAGQAAPCVVSSFRWTPTRGGFVVEYAIRCEALPSVPAAPGQTGGMLTQLLGSTLSDGLTQFTSGIASAASYATSVIGTAGSVLGEVTPIANMIGLGGIAAKINDRLTQASMLTTSVTNIGAAPAVANGILASLTAAGSNVSALISQAGANIAGISASTPTSLAAVSVNAQVLSTATQAGAVVNQANKQVLQALGGSTASVLVA